MKTILITGGAGFIGSNFARYIYRKYSDYKVVVLDKLTYAGDVENLPEDITKNPNNDGRFCFWYGDVCNGELVTTLVDEADIVVHFAAETHVTRSIYDNLLFYQTDVLGTQAVTNAICKHPKGSKLFIHISTSEVYGTAIKGSIEEDHPLNPMSPYASAKCGADRLVYSYGMTYDIPTVIIRPFNNFGPYQHLEKLIPRFITSVILDEPLTIHGGGTAARDFVFVEDVCGAIDTVIHSPVDKVKNQVFNVGSGVHRSINEIAQDILRIMGVSKDSVKTVNIGDRPGQVFRHTAGCKKIKAILGWKPAVDWETGLEKTIEWYKDNRKWWEKQLWMRHIPIITSSGKRELH